MFTPEELENNLSNGVSNGVSKNVSSLLTKHDAISALSIGGRWLTNQQDLQVSGNKHLNILPIPRNKHENEKIVIPVKLLTFKSVNSGIFVPDYIIKKLGDILFRKIVKC